MPRPASIVVVLFLAMSLSGCASDGPSIAKPRLGDTYEYHAEDGTAVTVVVDRLDKSLGPWLREHEVVVLEWTVWPSAGRGASYVMEEHVDRARGLVVRHVVPCGIGQKPAPEDRSFPCDPKSAETYFAGAGKPGGFGVGPSWIGDGRPPERIVSASPYDNEMWIYRLGSHHERSDRSCEMISRVDAGAARFIPQSLPLTITGPGLTVCDGLALPTSFSTADGLPPWFSSAGNLTFDLVKATRGQGAAVTFESSDMWSAPSTAPAPVLGGKNRLFETSDSSLPFTLKEAHDEASRFDEGYRSAFEAAGGVGIIDAVLGTGGHRRFNFVLWDQEEWFSQWSLRVHVGNGTDYALDITKTTKRDQDTYSERFEVNNQRYIRTAFEASPDRVDAGGAGLHGWLSWSEQWWGTSEVTNVRFGHQVRGDIIPAEPEWRSDEHTMSFTFLPPQDDANAGLQVAKLWVTKIHGPSNALVYLGGPTK